MAQRQAALLGVMAAGAQSIRLMFRACRLYLQHIACHEKLFSGKVARLSV